MAVSDAPFVAPAAGFLGRLAARRSQPRRWRAIISSGTGIVGLVCLALVLGVVCLGPFTAPYSPYDSVGIPFGSPGPGMLFGTDNLGRDVLSRWLHGGSQVM